FMVSPVFVRNRAVFRQTRGSRIDHEFQKIAVRVPNINTRAGPFATTRAVHRTYFDFDSGAIQHRLERSRGPVPDKAQIRLRFHCRHWSTLPPFPSNKLPGKTLSRQGSTRIAANASHVGLSQDGTILGL